MPSTRDFEDELDSIFQQATNLRLCYVGIRSRDLHDKLGGNNEYPKCCGAMENKRIDPKDQIKKGPRRGHGRDLIILYEIPR
jgi:hypothetical protein